MGEHVMEGMVSGNTNVKIYRTNIKPYIYIYI